MQASATVMAAMPSSSGGARGSTQGSWRPFTERVWALPSKVHVSWSWEMDDAGLMATRMTIGSPELMPPRVPPAWFDWQRSRPLLAPAKRSLWADPSILAARNPSPISKAFVAGRDIIAFARSASSLSKHGSPRPTGAPVTTQVQTPPVESSFLRSSWIRAAMRAAVAGCGHLVKIFFPWAYSRPNGSVDAGIGEPSAREYLLPALSTK
mmetsp:Transcript_85601/g.239671  ORF Transcript_85601/g.239671 Transcript_85601/m.239671 type:complete len:209 (-) Transcript_85601:653-1279(-)